MSVFQWKYDTAVRCEVARTRHALLSVRKVYTEKGDYIGARWSVFFVQRGKQTEGLLAEIGEGFVANGSLDNAKRAAEQCLIDCIRMEFEFLQRAPTPAPEAADVHPNP